MFQGWRHCFASSVWWVRFPPSPQKFGSFKYFTYICTVILHQASAQARNVVLTAAPNRRFILKHENFIYILFFEFIAPESETGNGMITCKLIFT